MRNRMLRVGLAFLVIAVLVAGSLFIPLRSNNFVSSTFQKALTIGMFGVAYAAGTPDYTCDGSVDDLQFQQAIGNLTLGGKLEILAGNYSFAATVTSSVGNITIEGTGLSSYLAYNASSPLFTAGGNNWVFRDIATDAGGINVGATTGWIMENVKLGATYYALRTSESITGASFDIPTGRTATLVVAASDSSAAAKAQADYVCDGTDDQVQIDQAIAALPANGGGVRILAGTYNTTTHISLEKANAALEGTGYGTIISLTGIDENVIESSANYVTIRDMKVTKDGTGATKNGITFYGNYSTVENVYVGCTKANQGIDLYLGGTNGTVRDCLVDGTITNAGISVNQYDSLIEGNTINGSTTIGLGIDVRLPRCKIIGNYINGCSGQFQIGLAIDTAPYTTEVIISDNTCVGLYNVTPALWVDECIHASGIRGIISSNYCYGAEGPGILIDAGTYGETRCYQNTVSSNVIQNCTDGIYLYGAGNNSIVGNVIESVTNGMWLIPHGSFLASYNVISANTMSNTTRGIVIDGTDYNTIVGNNLAGCGTKIDVWSGGTHNICNSNMGWATENWGSGNITSGNTYIDITHGCSATPTRINITPTGNTTSDTGTWWYDTVGSSTFRVHTANNPGASGFTFNWETLVR